MACPRSRRCSWPVALLATVVVRRPAPARHAGPGGAEPRARHHRQPLRPARGGGDRLLDPRRRVDLVPLHEGGVHPRRDDHPARAAARRAAAASRCSCRSGRWPTCRRASRPGSGSRGCSLEQLFWIGVLARRRVAARSEPASDASRWSADEGPLGDEPQRLRRGGRQAGRPRGPDADHGDQRLRVGDLLGAVLRPRRHPRRLGPRQHHPPPGGAHHRRRPVARPVRQRALHRHDGRRRRPRRRARAPGAAAALRAPPPDRPGEPRRPRLRDRPVLRRVRPDARSARWSSCSSAWRRPRCSPASSCSPARWRSSSGAARAASSASTGCSCSAPTRSTSSPAPSASSSSP